MVYAVVSNTTARTGVRVRLPLSALTRGGHPPAFSLMTRTALLNLIVGLALGLALGLVYTWKIDPVKYTDAAPDSLRADYKSDYVLMIAQAYGVDSDLDLARARLATLNAPDPAQLVANIVAQQTAAGAPPGDVSALNALAAALNISP